MVSAEKSGEFYGVSGAVPELSFVRYVETIFLSRVVDPIITILHATLHDRDDPFAAWMDCDDCGVCSRVSYTQPNGSVQEVWWFALRDETTRLTAVFCARSCCVRRPCKEHATIKRRTLPLVHAALCTSPVSTLQSCGVSGLALRQSTTGPCT